MRDWRKDRRRDRIDELLDALNEDDEEEKGILEDIEDYGPDDDLNVEEREDQIRLYRDLDRIRYIEPKAFHQDETC